MLGRVPRHVRVFLLVVIVTVFRGASSKCQSGGGDKEIRYFIKRFHI